MSGPDDGGAKVAEWRNGVGTFSASKPSRQGALGGGAGASILSSRAGADSAFWSLSPWAFGPRKLMRNGHNDMFQPIRAIPFVFSTDSFLAGGFSTLRCPGGKGKSKVDKLPRPTPSAPRGRKVCASPRNRDPRFNPTTNMLAYKSVFVKRQTVCVVF